MSLQERHTELLSQIGETVAVLRDRSERANKELDQLAVTAATKDDIRALRDTLRTDFVTRAEFDFVKRFTWGLAALTGTAVAGAILRLVLR